jgi:hypothetical protein
MSRYRQREGGKPRDRRKPPREHQFKPGQSGNLNGRPKGSKNETSVLRALLHRKIAVREGTKSRKISVLEAILLRITEDALKGNTKSATFLLNRLAEIGGSEAGVTNHMSEDDREVLKAFVRRVAGSPE